MSIDCVEHFSQPMPPDGSEAGEEPHMPYQVYATVVGAKQGAFKGGAIQKGREGKIHVISVGYGVSVTTFREGTGASIGKRVEQPLTFSLLWEGCSPQFFTAAYTNEVLSTVQFEYYGTDKTGIEKLNHTVKLTNATVIEIKEAYANVIPDGVGDGKEAQTVSLNFQKIEITSTVSGATAIDDLHGNV
jgi:type VI secretion system secreted protein Hcp